MWFWRIYLGLAAVGLVLILLGGAGSGLHVPSRTSAADDQSTRTGPRHRRDVKPRPTVAPRSAPRLGAVIGRRLRRAPRAVVGAQAVGPVRSGVLRCSRFAISLGTALVVSATCVIGLALSVEALYWGGERLFGQDWVEFLDGLLG